MLNLSSAFSGHSIGLFSIHDDPPETSIRSTRPRNAPMASSSEVGGKRRRGSSGASRLQRVPESGRRRDETSDVEDETESKISEAPTTGGDETAEPTTGEGDNQERHEASPRGARRRYGFGLSARSLMVSDDEGDENDNHSGAEGVAMDDGENEDEDDEDDDMSADEEELEAILADEEEGLYPSEETAISPFASAPVVYPRRLYKGARNVETVKDVTFLGAEKNYIGSGSDDGNFFVWSREGKLEGIWEGDGSVVNVIEQHPSLPLCAVSGIDSTVKVGFPLLAKIVLTGH